MKDTIIVGNGSKPEIKQHAGTIKEILEQHSNLLAMDLENEIDLKESNADLIVTLGGDGTVLKTSNRLGKHQIPILGINFGKLGFLTAIERHQAVQHLSDILQNPLDVSTRLRLRGTLYREQQEIFSFSSLNDVVITRGGISRMVKIDLQIDGERIVFFEGDGLVITTPTGSTAHNLSAGGPILSPGTDAFGITPLAPHTLTMRPIVVPSENKIDIEVEQTPEEAVLTTDGQIHQQLQKGDQIQLCASEQPGKLVVPPSHSFFSTLNQKLHWGKTPLSDPEDDNITR